RSWPSGPVATTGGWVNSRATCAEKDSANKEKSTQGTFAGEDDCSRTRVKSTQATSGSASRRRAVVVSQADGTTKVSPSRAGCPARVRVPSDTPATSRPGNGASRIRVRNTPATSGRGGQPKGEVQYPEDGTTRANQFKVGFRAKARTPLATRVISRP